ncbi:hypothetical protein AV540_12720 [Brevibacillus parabrevis]|uniref:DUF3238 domain-containing protein n=1 Tax=Brevibacillus parabrevis TaxID=54914 RepID=UPI0007ABF6C8|nr:DUF3238 domain-containing protein [Brevibacillus parabrevis]KZE51723.1 hypothetical protein AV540_12720 [Brevibacillus parabrevis]
MGTTSNRVRVRIKSFIPEDKVKDPYGDWYEGDDRGFSYGGTYRTRHIITVNFDNKEVKDSTNVGRTCKVNPGEAKGCDRTDDSGIVLKRIRWKSGYVELEVSCSAGNPLSLMAPAIDYEMTLRVYEHGLVTVKGSHDGFPNYEVWKKVGEDDPVMIYGYDHGNKTLWDLAPPMDVTFSLVGK